MVYYTHTDMLISLCGVPLKDNIHRLAAATEHNLSECYHMKIDKANAIPYKY